MFIMLIIGMLIALAFFFYFNNQRIRNMEERNERSREKFARLVDSLREKKDK